MSKRAEADRLRMVVETQSEIAGSRLDVDEVMRRVVERAREITDAAAAVVEMADGDELVYRAASGTATQFLGLRMEAAKSLSGLCMDTGQLLRCDDASTDPRVNAELCLRLGAVSMICVPLATSRRRNRGRAQALRVRQPEAFDAADEETLGLLSGVIAAHLTNATEFAAARDESRRDALTGLGNRRAYDEALIREAARAARYGSLLSLALFDVDGFKAVNDRYGHPRGDAVLAEVGRILGERAKRRPGIPVGWRRVRARAGRDGVERRPARGGANGRGGGRERADRGTGHPLDGRSPRRARWIRGRCTPRPTRRSTARSRLAPRPQRGAPSAAGAGTSEGPEGTPR